MRSGARVGGVGVGDLQLIQAEGGEQVLAHARDSMVARETAPYACAPKA